jgi:digeranylgeranylglycerophospholipid reductase
VVVGAGPAGSIAAMTAAKQGVKTLILEKEPLPRYKLCGGAIPNWVVSHLNIPEEILQREYNVLSYFSSPNYNRQDNNLGNGKYFGINRDSFDYHLTRMAVEEGAKLNDKSKVTSVIREHEQVRGVITSEGEKYLTNVVIACDGQLSLISKKCGMWSKWFRKKGEKWQDHTVSCVGVEIKMGKEIIDERFGNSFMFLYGDDIIPSGYAWLFPKRRTISVGIGGIYRNLKKKTTEYLNCLFEKNPIVTEMLKGGEIIKKKGAWIPIQTPYKPSYDAGLLIAGDAASMVSPISGEGILFAIRAGTDAGKAAAEAVIEGDFSADFLSKYQKRWEISIGLTLKFQVQFFHNLRAPNQIPQFFYSK